MLDTSMKYIGLYENHWRVRIKQRNKPAINIPFNFNKHGGKKTALVKARACRNKILNSSGQISRLNFEKSPDLYAYETKTNPIIGVYRSLSGYLFSWTVRLSICGEEIKRSFSINKYGEKEAFRKACKVRSQYMGTLIVINKSAMPCGIGLPKIVRPNI